MNTYFKAKNNDFSTGKRTITKLGERWIPTLLKMLVGLALSSCGGDGDSMKTVGHFDENNSYWSRFLPNVNPSLDKDIEVDVAVIGGGYTGLSAAYHIKKTNPDLKVVILEAKRVGNGASGRNGALVLAQTYSEGGIKLGLHAEFHKEIYKITVESMRRLKKLAESSGIDPEYVLNGQCAGIYNPENLDDFKEYVDAAQNMGLPIEFWDKDKAVSKLGTQSILGAVFDPNGGTVNPAKLVAALKNWLKMQGL